MSVRTVLSTLRRGPAIAGYVLLSMLLHAAANADGVMPSLQTLKSVEDSYGQHARLRLEHWRDMVEASRGASEYDKLQRVNEFFNQVAFVNDIDHWGVEDYWATPLQLLSSNGGDCEDFSIAKYFTLRQMGIPAKRLRLTYVKAIDLNQAHMVLTYFPTPASDPLVLDNLINDIRASSVRTDLEPVYSFNAEGLWLARERGAEKRVGKAERLSRWKAVVARISTEQSGIVDRNNFR